MIDWTETGVSVTADWWTLGLWVGLVLAIPFSGWVIWRAWRRDRKQPTLAWTHVWAISIERVQDWFGIRKADKAASTLLTLILMAFAALFVLALIASFILIIVVILPSAPTDPALPSSANQSLGLGALLVAVLGGPFLIWRTVIAAKQAALQDEALFNDKINAAAEDLAARRQVTTVLKEGDDRTVITEWQDDVVTRSAAIDRLEGLARERPEVTPRIAAMLSVYVRELSKQDGLRARELGLSEETATPKAIAEWAQGLTPIRSDMEKAAQAMGRLRRIEGQDALRLDLRDANLQGFNLSFLDFNAANLSGVRMEGAEFPRAQMQGAVLGGAQMQGAVLLAAQLQGANLILAQMQGADLSAAKMQGASLSKAQMQGASLSKAQMQGADLRGAKMQGADLPGAQMQGASLSGAQMQLTDLNEAQMQAADLQGAQLQRANLHREQLAATFGDASVTLPFANPVWWPDVALDWQGWRIEFTHWRANPDTYDWSQRRQHYTARGNINPDNPPPEYKPSRGAARANPKRRHPRA